MKTNQNQNTIHAIGQSAPAGSMTIAQVADEFSRSGRAPCRSFRRTHLDYLLEDYADIPATELTSQMVLRAFAKRWNHNPAKSREARTRYTIDHNDFSNN